MWLSIGDFGGGVTVGSPLINLSTSGETPPNANSMQNGFDYSAILKSPYFYAFILAIVFILINRKKR